MTCKDTNRVDTDRSATPSSTQQKEEPVVVMLKDPGCALTRLRRCQASYDQSVIRAGARADDRQAALR